MWIPDPIELMEAAIERQCDLVDAAGTYPCIICGRRFPVENMEPISAHPAASLACGRADCKPQVRREEQGDDDNSTTGPR